MPIMHDPFCSFSFIKLRPQMLVLNEFSINMNTAVDSSSWEHGCARIAQVPASIIAGLLFLVWSERRSARVGADSLTEPLVSTTHAAAARESAPSES